MLHDVLLMVFVMITVCPNILASEILTNSKHEQGMILFIFIFHHFMLWPSLSREKSLQK